MKVNKICVGLMAFLCTFLQLNIAHAKIDFTDLVTKEEFFLYKDVGEFIKYSPQVTVRVIAEESDIEKHGAGVVKTLTGSGCDRDGKMDDNQSCNAVYYKLWLKYRLRK